MQELIKKAGILIEALPYIQKFSGKTVVIKYGGNAMINEELKNSVMEDITLLKFIGLNPIVVHGGGPDISKALNERGVKSKFVNGLRVTDDITMQTAQQVLIGKTNKEIVALLNTNGGRAVGISGIDGSFIECKKQYTEVDGEKVDIGYVGDIVHVKHCLIDLLSSDQYIPVIAPIGTDEDGNSYNINADTAAEKLAVALKAKKLILLTDVCGLMRDPKDDSTLIPRLKVSEVPALIKEGVISGGMIPKVDCCVEAVRQGVERANIQDGRVPHSILVELLSDDGVGTMFS